MNDTHADNSADSSYKRQRASGSLDKPFDAIVIGSGAGGLTSAALLALEGQRVLVLEQHATAGGCTQVFKREGFEWDAGLHYMGEVHRAGSGLARLFDRVTGGRLQWAPMPDVYNKVVIGERSYDFVSGAQRFADRMKAYFPAEAGAIDRYLALIAGANRAAKAYFADRALPELSPGDSHSANAAEFLSYSRQTVTQVLRGLTSDPELIAVLCGHYGDYSLLPDDASFAVHAMLIKHYIDGASFPVGGSGRIPETMSQTVRAAGGQVLVSAEVVGVLVREGRACGVVMADGTTLEAPVVVSAIGIGQTLGLLNDADAEGIAALRAKAVGLRLSQCYVMLNLGLSASNAELAMDPANMWVHPGNDLTGNYRRYEAAPHTQPFPLHFISQPSAKDPSWPERYPGRSTIDICSLTDWKVFEPHAQTRWMRRGDTYEAMKQKMTEEMLAQVYRFYPQARGKVTHMELATPLSFNHFLGRSQGDFMSYAQTPERFEQRWMRAHSPVKNLYFSAQDVAGAGVSGAMVGGMVAASAVVGRDLFKTLRA